MRRAHSNTFGYDWMSKNSAEPSYKSPRARRPYHDQFTISAMVYSSPAIYGRFPKVLFNKSNWRFVSIVKRSIGYFIGSGARSEEHTSELQSRFDLVCRLLLEKK